jgi:polysaccharide biosynthesis protein PslH
MKVLFLTHEPPYPPSSGDRIRSFHELRALVARGHEVHLLSFAEGPREWRQQRELKGLCASVTLVRRARGGLRLLAGLLLSSSRVAKPLALSAYDSRRMRQTVRRQLARLRPDAVFADSAATAQFVPGAWAARTVVDLASAGGGVGWPGGLGRALRPLWRRRARQEAGMLQAYEAQLARRLACSIVATEDDARPPRRAAGRRSNGRGSRPRPPR